MRAEDRKSVLRLGSVVLLGADFLVYGVEVVRSSSSGKMGIVSGEKLSIRNLSPSTHHRLSHRLNINDFKYWDVNSLAKIKTNRKVFETIG